MQYIIGLLFLVGLGKLYQWSINQIFSENINYWWGLGGVIAVYLVFTLVHHANNFYTPFHDIQKSITVGGKAQIVIAILLTIPAIIIT